MFQPEDNSNPNRPQNSASDQNLDNIDANISTKNVAARKKQIESVFIKLIAVGLTVGTVLGIGGVYLLNKLGLTKKPDQIEQKRIEPEQQKDPVDQVYLFPSMSKSFKA
ncbi:MAG TPA: hypothetical protein V6C71_04435 [Coleofasciculaceae cyanobacterium]|jgi:hypothetical protein